MPIRVYAILIIAVLLIAKWSAENPVDKAEFREYRPRVATEHTDPWDTSGEDPEIEKEPYFLR